MQIVNSLIGSNAIERIVHPPAIEVTPVSKERPLTLPIYLTTFAVEIIVGRGLWPGYTPTRLPNRCATVANDRRIAGGGRLAARIHELVSGHVTLERIAEPMLTAREAFGREFGKLHREVLAIVKEDQVCPRLMTVQGVDALYRWPTAPTYITRHGLQSPSRSAPSSA